MRTNSQSANELTAILVPMVSRELNQLEFLFFLWGLWGLVGRLSGTPSESAVRLIVSLDGDSRPDLEENISEAYGQFGLSEIFSDLTIGFCDIPPEENIYIRTGQQPPERIPRLGLKSGPNTQFFCSLSKFCVGENTVLLNEVDCFPVVGDWIGRLKGLVAGAETFWILGSPYRGWGRLGPELLSHVNGNALYGVGVRGFAKFVSEWEQLLAEEVTRNPDLAYDIFLAYRHAPLFDPARWGTTPIGLFRSLQEILCRTRFTPSIHNLAGEEEISGRTRIDLDAYLVDHTETALVHARFLKLQVLQKALSEAREVMGCGRAERDAVADYLIDASSLLLDRDNLDVSREIMNMFPSVATA